MATAAPQPPRPPQPPQPPLPPRRTSNALPIILGILGLIILLCGLAIWGGLHFIAHDVKVQVSQGLNSKEVTVKTPFGAMQVNKGVEVTEASLGLPIYPDARPAKDDRSATVSLGLPGKTRLRIVAGQFDSGDSLEKVRDFYRSRLTAEDGAFTIEARIDSDHHDLDDKTTGNFTGTDGEGKTVFKLKGKEDERIVALESRNDGTRIELVRVSKSSEEPN